MFKEQFNVEMRIERESISRLNEYIEGIKQLKEDIKLEKESVFKNNYKVKIFVHSENKIIKCKIVLFNDKTEIVRELESNSFICESYGFKLENQYYDVCLTTYDEMLSIDMFDDLLEYGLSNSEQSNDGISEKDILNEFIKNKNLYRELADM